VILGRTTIVAFMLLVSVFVGSAGAVTITEFPTGFGNSALPEQMIAGPDGNLWWTQDGSKPGIGRMTPSGELLPLIGEGGEPTDLVKSPSGWVSWAGLGGFGYRSPEGVIGRYYDESFAPGAITVTAAGEVRIGGKHTGKARTICTPNVPTSDHIEIALGTCIDAETGGTVKAMAASPQNFLWGSLPSSDQVWITTATPLKSQLTVDLPSGSNPQGIAIGPEGNAWVAMYGANAIDRITPTGGRTRFPLPANSHPYDLVLGPDGSFWILEEGIGKIGRMTTAGLVTNEFAIPSEEFGQSGITVGPEGNIWFSDTELSLIGRLIPDPLPTGGGGGAGGGGQNPGSDKTAPRFTAAPKFAPAAFRAVGATRSRSSAGGPSGSTLTFSLSEAASVTTVIAAKAHGRRAGRACVAPGKAKPGAKRCIRFVTKGSMKLTGAAGSNKSKFTGKLNGKALSPGGYRATLSARDGAGNASVAATANFTILR
jgi:streptogramin lyase